MDIIMIKLIYHLALHLSKCYLIQKYGKDFWIKFKATSDKTFAEILPQVPDIGNSIFSLNYKFGPSYIAWYKSFLELGTTQDETIQNIWTMNEKMVTTIPRPFLKATGKLYLNGFRKKAATHVTRQGKGDLHPYDWAITYREINQNCLNIGVWLIWSTWSVFILNLVFILFLEIQVHCEEDYLLSIHGTKYLEFKQRTKRYIPFIY